MNEDKEKIASGDERTGEQIAFAGIFSARPSNNLRPLIGKGNFSLPRRKESESLTTSCKQRL
jgi:hypothetical protein